MIPHRNMLQLSLAKPLATARFASRQPYRSRSLQTGS